MNQTGWSCFFMCNAQLERMETHHALIMVFHAWLKFISDSIPALNTNIIPILNVAAAALCSITYCGNVSNVILGLMAEYKINMIHTHNFHFLLTFSSLRKELFSIPIGFKIKKPGKVAGLFCKNTR